MRAASQHSVKAGSGVPELQNCIPRETRDAAGEGGGGSKVERRTGMATVKLALTGICQVLSQVVFFRAINSANHYAHVMSGLLLALLHREAQRS